MQPILAAPLLFRERLAAPHDFWSSWQIQPDHDEWSQIHTFPDPAAFVFNLWILSIQYYFLPSNGQTLQSMGGFTGSGDCGSKCQDLLHGVSPGFGVGSLWWPLPSVSQSGETCGLLTQHFQI